MKIGHTGITVADMTVSKPWYEDTFGLKTVFEIERGVTDHFMDELLNIKGVVVKMAALQAENGLINLIEYTYHEYEPRRDTPARQGSAHLCFDCGPGESEAIMAKIPDKDLIGKCVVPDGKNVGNKVFYFRDPDGFILELTEYTRFLEPAQ